MINILALMFLPPIILFILGVLKLKRNKRVAKVLFIIGGVYLLIGLGLCGVLDY